MNGATSLILTLLFGRLAAAAEGASTLEVQGVDPAGSSRRPAHAIADQGAPDLGLVRVDPLNRTLRFPVVINQRTGPVEYALVTSQGKTHESVFRTDAEPTHIHLGPLLLGGKPVYTRRLPTILSQPLPGEPVLIEITWIEDGVEIRKPLEAFAITTDNMAPLSPGPWVYNGSVMTGDGLVAQKEGSIISLWIDPSALINNPRSGRENDELHRANSKALPAESISLQLVIRLVKDQEPPAGSQQSTNAAIVDRSEDHGLQ